MKTDTLKSGIEFSTWIEVLRSRAHDNPSARAYTFLVDGEREGVHLTYGELDARARSIGALLQERGARGERVLLLYPPGLEYIAAFFGCLYARRRGGARVSAAPQPQPAAAALDPGGRAPPGRADHGRDPRPGRGLAGAGAVARRHPLAGDRTAWRRWRGGLGGPRSGRRTPSPSCSTPRARPARPRG